MANRSREGSSGEKKEPGTRRGEGKRKVWERRGHTIAEFISQHESEGRGMTLQRREEQEVTACTCKVEGKEIMGGGLLGILHPPEESIKPKRGEAKRIVPWPEEHKGPRHTSTKRRIR